MVGLGLGVGGRGREGWMDELAGAVFPLLCLGVIAMMWFYSF